MDLPSGYVTLWPLYVHLLEKDAVVILFHRAGCIAFVWLNFKHNMHIQFWKARDSEPFSSKCKAKKADAVLPKSPSSLESTLYTA